MQFAVEKKKKKKDEDEEEEEEEEEEECPYAVAQGHYNSVRRRTAANRKTRLLNYNVFDVCVERTAAHATSSISARANETRNQVQPAMNLGELSLYGHVQQKNHNFAFEKASVIGRARQMHESWSSTGTLNRAIDLHPAYQALRTMLESVRTRPLGRSSKATCGRQPMPAESRREAGQHATPPHRDAHETEINSHEPQQLISPLSDEGEADKHAGSPTITTAAKGSKVTRTHWRSIAESSTLIGGEPASALLFTELRAVGLDLAIETIELQLQDKYDKTENRLGRAQVLQLLKFCLRTYFTFDGTIYEQVKETTMGSPISGFIAEAVLQRLESLVFQHHKPKFWAPYVDDIFVVIERDQVLTFKEHLNAVFPDNQFTMEEEENNQLAFLDVLVCRKDCGGLKTKVFRKATNTMQILNFNSNHPIRPKPSCVRTLNRHGETHCNEPEDKIAELQYLRRVLKAHGYPRNFVNRYIRKRDERPNRTDTKVWRALPYVKNVSEAVGCLFAPLGVGVAHRPEATIRRLVMKPKTRCHGMKRLKSFIGSSAVADKATTLEKPEDTSE
ncbi:hypothetical protein SprV_0100239000 [Sparganum proliferum]